MDLKNFYDLASYIGAHKIDLQKHLNNCDDFVKECAVDMVLGEMINKSQEWSPVKVLTSNNIYKTIDGIEIKNLPMSVLAHMSICDYVKISRENDEGYVLGLYSKMFKPRMYVSSDNLAWFPRETSKMVGGMKHKIRQTDIFGKFDKYKVLNYEDENVLNAVKKCLNDVINQVYSLNVGSLFNFRTFFDMIVSFFDDAITIFFFDDDESNTSDSKLVLLNNEKLYQIKTE